MRKKWLLFLVIAVILASLTNLFNFPLKQALGRLLHPAGAWMYSLGQQTRSIVGEVPRLGSLQDEITVAESEVTKLRLQLVALERLRGQNDQLRRELAFARDYEYELLPADVVNYQPDSVREMLRINLGSNDGVSEGMAVVSEGLLVGRIYEVNNRFSSVILVTDTEFRAVVSIKGTSGVLRGQVGSSVVVERLSRNQGIEPTDLVITSGQDGVYPPGLLVGTVRSLTQAPGSVFDTAQVDPEARPRSLQVVMVVNQ